jgi:hypothetical protein
MGINGKFYFVGLQLATFDVKSRKTYSLSIKVDGTYILCEAVYNQRTALQYLAGKIRCTDNLVLTKLHVAINTSIQDRKVCKKAFLR